MHIEKRLSHQHGPLLLYGCIFCLVFSLLPMEVWAFSQSIVTKTNAVKDNLILIARACVGIGMVVFVFSLILSRPMWKLCVCLLAVGAIIGAFTTFYGFIISA